MTFGDRAGWFFKVIATVVSATVVSISQSYENIPVVADVFAQNYDSGALGAADVLVRQPKAVSLCETFSTYRLGDGTSPATCENILNPKKYHIMPSCGSRICYLCSAEDGIVRFQTI